MPFPGVPDDALAAVGDPDPLDLGLLRKAVVPLAAPPDGPLHGLLEFGRLFLAANTVVNLSGAKTWEALLVPHLLDCTLAAAFVPADARTLWDWGSGGGLPGLVWATLFPEKRILLSDRTRKKTDWLEEAAVRLGLTNVEVFAGPAEEVLRRVDVRPDLLIARAVEPLPKLMGRILRARLSYGALVVMAGPRWTEDWESVSLDIRKHFGRPRSYAYSLPGALERSLQILPHS